MLLCEVTAMSVGIVGSLKGGGVSGAAALGGRLQGATELIS
jgi:hypothetical protein